MRQAPNSGITSCPRAKSSTSSHHSVARSQSPALVHAVIRLQYASPSVWMSRTRPDEAAAIASSSSLIPSSRRPALTSARPSRLSAKTSRSAASVARPTAIARRACSAHSSTLAACRARSTATQPWPSHGPAPSSARSARDSQPRAADDAAGEVKYWCETHTAARAASVAVARARVPLERALARGDPLLDLPEEPERLAEAVVRLRRVLGRERGLERLTGRLPARGLERFPALDQLRRRP